MLVYYRLNQFICYFGGLTYKYILRNLTGLESLDMQLRRTW